MMLKMNNLTINRNRKYHLCLIDVSGCWYVVLQVWGKTNLLMYMIYRLLFFDKIYLYVKNLQHSKYQHLINLFEPISEEAGYPIIEATNDKIIPLDTMPCDNQKLVIFDDYLNTGVKNAIPKLLWY